MAAKENKRKSILEFLLGRQFIIPNFQRRYSWNKRHWNKIYDDIKNVSKEDSKQHFLGVIVYNIIHDSQSRGFDKLELIDGQQRITTIFLFLCALHKHDLIHDSKILEYLGFKTSNQTQPRLILTKLDNNEFQAILENQDVHRESKKHPLSICFNEFFNRINKDKERIKFFQGLKKLWVVDIGLESEKDDPHEVFESLNTTGKDLEIYDTIRNFLLMKLNSQKRDEMYDKNWLPMERKYGENIDKLRNFMFSYIGLKTENTFDEKSGIEPYFKFKDWFEKELKILKGYESQDETTATFNENQLEYLEWFNSCDENPTGEEYLFNQVITNAEYYLELAIKPEKNPSPRLRLPLCKLKSVDKKFNSPYSFLLGAYHKYKRNNNPNSSEKLLPISEDDFLDLLKIIESHYVRLQVCGVVQVGKYLPGLYAKMHSEISKDKYPYVESFQRKLSSNGRNYSFPNDNIFKQNFVHKQIEKASVQTFIIKCIELEQSRKSEETDEMRFAFFISMALTREHIMPNSLRKGKEIPEWIEELGGKSKWREVKDNWMNCIGNVTIAPPSDNSEMSDKPFSFKKEKYLNGESRYSINRYFDNIENWNQNQIQDRATHLFDIAIKIWPDYGFRNWYSLEKLIELGSGVKDLKINSFRLNDDEKSCTNWNSLYLEVFRFLFKNHKDELLILTSEKNNFNIKESDFCANIKGIKPLDNKYSINTNYAISKKINHLVTAFEKLKISENSLSIEIVNAQRK
ncbi:MAG: DUF262 domain-containing HNH endonuclease family protein [Flavobacteriaceae bacterium]|nr:DUF262 domain-containing HNH endonuclease family protein [Flavobacteriaceae bacterium]